MHELWYFCSSHRNREDFCCEKSFPLSNGATMWQCYGAVWGRRSKSEINFARMRLEGLGHSAQQELLGSVSVHKPCGWWLDGSRTRTLCRRLYSKGKEPNSSSEKRKLKQKLLLLQGQWFRLPGKADSRSRGEDSQPSRWWWKQWSQFTVMALDKFTSESKLLLILRSSLFFFCFIVARYVFVLWILRIATNSFAVAAPFFCNEKGTFCVSMRRFVCECFVTTALANKSYALRSH